MSMATMIALYMFESATELIQYLLLEFRTPLWRSREWKRPSTRDQTSWVSLCECDRARKMAKAWSAIFYIGGITLLCTWDEDHMWPLTLPELSWNREFSNKKLTCGIYYQLPDLNYRIHLLQSFRYLSSRSEPPLFFFSENSKDVN